MKNPVSRQPLSQLLTTSLQPNCQEDCKPGSTASAPNEEENVSGIRVSSGWRRTDAQDQFLKTITSTTRLAWGYIDQLHRYPNSANATEPGRERTAAELRALSRKLNAIAKELLRGAS